LIDVPSRDTELKGRLAAADQCWWGPRTGVALQAAGCRGCCVGHRLRPWE